MKRPITTLLTLMSADGGLAEIDGWSEEIYQYYEIAETTDLWLLISGEDRAKNGVNTKDLPEKSSVSFAMIDDKCLTEQGIRYFCALSKEFVLITSNPEHPAYNFEEGNLHIIFQDKPDLCETLAKLRSECGCRKITVRNDGGVSEILMREKLFDCVNIVIDPVMIGGRETSTLIDGTALISKKDIKTLGKLELQGYGVLKNSYLELRYRAVR